MSKAIAKTAKLNGFSLFMKERRPDLEAQGASFPGGLKDVALALNNEWKDLSEEKKEEYKVRAKSISSFINEEQRSKPSGAASSGSKALFPLTDIRKTFGEVNERKLNAADATAIHIRDLRLMLENSDPRDATFIIINFNIYGQLIEKLYIPAEVALTAFNLKDGIIDNYSTLIDPITIPVGLGIEARTIADEAGLPYPPFDNSCQAYREIVTTIEKFVDKHTSNMNKQRKVYCMTHEMKVVNGCLDWIYSQLKRKSDISTHSFGEAMKMLSTIGIANRARNENKNVLEIIGMLIEDRETRDAQSSSKRSIISGDIDLAKIKAGVFFNESQVEDFLSSYELAFDGELACPYHFHKDVGIEPCALNKTNRYAYNMLDVLTNTYGIKNRKETFHFPAKGKNAEKEANRRKELLTRWGNFIFSEKSLVYDPRMKPPDRIPDPQFGAIVPK